jgi:hypothetical protein
MTQDMQDNEASRRRWLYAAVAAVAALIVVGIGVLAFQGDDEDTATDETTTTTEAPEETTTTTEAPEETTTTEAPEETTTTTAPPVDASTAVFPFAEDEQRFDDPLELAEAYAEGVLGFVDPLYSEFRQGDSRSGEVGVRPIENGPETILLLRQLGADDTWWVLGAVSENIVVEEPEANEVLTSPVTLRGQARAFEGTVNVDLWTDRADEPLVETFVTGGGDQMRPFEGTLTFDQPETRFGSLILRAYDADTGGVWEATVLRVRF